MNNKPTKGSQESRARMNQVLYDEVGCGDYRDDYLDLWAKVRVEHIVKVKENGAFVTKIMVAEVIVGHEFLDLSPTIIHASPNGGFCDEPRNHSGPCLMCGARFSEYAHGTVEAGSAPTLYNRSHVGTFAKDGSFWEAFGLGNGRNVCDQAISSDWQFRLFGTNRAWNRPLPQEEAMAVA